MYLQLICALVVLAAYILYKYYEFHVIVNRIRLPGPKPVPFFGNLFDVDLSTTLWYKAMEWQNKYGNMFQVFYMFRRIVIIGGDYETVKDVYTNGVFHKAPVLEDLNGQSGLIFSEGEPWARARKICSSAFNIQHLRLFTDHMHLCADHLVEKLRTLTSSKQFQNYVDMDEIFMRSALDCIGRTMFSIDFQALDTDSEITDHIQTYLSEAFQQAVNSVHWITHPLSLMKRKRSAQFLIGYVDAIINSRAELRKTQHSHESRDLLDLLFDAHDNSLVLSKKEIRDQVFTFMFAGHETTAHTLAFALANIAQHPNVAKKIREELDQTIGTDPTAKIGHEHKLPYLNAVIKETLRMYPIAPSIPRILAEDRVVGGHLLPAGTRVAISLCALHYNPQVWDNPTVFDPERFLTLNDATSANFFAHSPFGHGRRSCLGQHFAMMEMRIFLGSLMRNFDFALTPLAGVIVKQNFTFRPKDGLKTTVWPYIATK